MSLEYPDGFILERDTKRPICGVVSVAICAGVSLEVATATLRANMAAHRSRFRGSTNHNQRFRALKQLGCQIEAHTIVGKINLRNWFLKYAEPGKLYSVRITGHVVTIKDGMAIDQHRHVPIHAYKGAGKMVKQWIVVNGKGW